MKITREILRDYKDFKVISDKNKTLTEKTNGQLEYLECPFCETGNGAVEYDSENDFLVCRACNHWWMVRKPRILINYKYNIKLYFILGMIAGIIIMFLFTYFISLINK